jgi:hypothetical protein
VITFAKLDASCEPLKSRIGIRTLYQCAPLAALLGSGAKRCYARLLVCVTIGGIRWAWEVVGFE